MRYRVFKHRDGYYLAQYKGWFFWNSFVTCEFDSADGGYECKNKIFGSKDAAIKYIEKDIRKERGAKVRAIKGKESAGIVWGPRGGDSLHNDDL